MFVGVLTTPLEIVKHEQSATCDECNRRRMLTGNTEKYKSPTWNIAIHKKSAARKDCYTKRCNMEMVQYEKSATCKECSIKKCNMEKYKSPQQNTERTQKNSGL